MTTTITTTVAVEEVLPDTLPPPPPSNGDTLPSSSGFESDSRLPAAPRVPSVGQAIQPVQQRPDPNSWTDSMLVTIVEGMQSVKERDKMVTEELAALRTERLQFKADAERLIQTAAERFEHLLDSNMRLLHVQFGVERGRTTSNEQSIASLRAEVDTFHARMAELETAIRARLDAFEAEMRGRFGTSP